MTLERLDPIVSQSLSNDVQLLAESIRDFKKKGYLLKWIHSNGVMNPSAVIIYSIVDSIIHAFSSSFRTVDPKRGVSTIIESFWFNKERLKLLVFSKKVFP